MGAWLLPDALITLPRHACNPTISTAGSLLCELLPWGCPVTPAARTPAGTKDKEGNEVWKSRIGHFGAQELSNILLAFTRVQLYNQELLQVTPTP